MKSISISDIVRSVSADLHGPQVLKMINIPESNGMTANYQQPNLMRDSLKDNIAPDGCDCYRTCNSNQCGTKCSCEFWYESEQSAIQHSHDMMQKNAYFRNKYGASQRPHRFGNDYFNRLSIDRDQTMDINNEKRYDRRSKASQDPFKGVISGKKVNSWDRYEDDTCYYQICRDEVKQCAWFYDFYHCGENRNNNGRYYDEYFARARFDFSSPGTKYKQHDYDYGLAKLIRTRIHESYSSKYTNN